MKKLKENQTGPWCSFCPYGIVRAVYRTSSWTDNRFCCENHTEELKKYEHNGLDLGRMTEADFQTWYYK